MLPILGLLSPLISGVTGYISKKQDIKRADHEAIMKIKAATVDAQIRRLESADKADVALDTASIGKVPWGDDWLLVMFSAPMVMIFASPFVDLYYAAQVETFLYEQGMLATAVGTGFDELAKAPKEFFYGFGAVVVYVLGMRRMLRELISKWGNPFKK